jgi:hypothetical protein
VKGRSNNFKKITHSSLLIRLAVQFSVTCPSNYSKNFNKEGKIEIERGNLFKLEEMELPFPFSEHSPLPSSPPIELSSNKR